MRKLGMRILDEAMEIAAGASHGFTDAITSETMAEPLGRYDRLALQAIVEGAVTGAAAATIWLGLETSCDGIHWVSKSESSVHTLDPGGDTVFWFADDGSLPSHALIRIRARLSCEGAVRARVRVFATARDSGAHDLQGVAPLGAYMWLPDATAEPLPPRPPGGVVCPV